MQRFVSHRSVCNVCSKQPCDTDKSSTMEGCSSHRTKIPQQFKPQARTLHHTTVCHRHTVSALRVLTRSEPIDDFSSCESESFSAIFKSKYADPQEKRIVKGYPKGDISVPLQDSRRWDRGARTCCRGKCDDGSTTNTSVRFSVFGLCITG